MYHYEMSEQVIKREKAAARELRHSRWWQSKIANQAKCSYCAKSLKKDECTMDHVLPISRGGRSTKANVVISCKDCNNLKKDRMLMEWTGASTAPRYAQDNTQASDTTGLHKPSHEPQEQ